MSEFITDQIRVIFFDHDDTLMGAIGPKWDQHKHVAKTYYDKELTDAEIKAHWGKPFADLVCLLYGTDDTEQAIANNTACQEDYPKELFTATLPTLERVKNAGRITGIITAAHRLSFEFDLGHHDITSKLVDYTQTSDDTPYHKPDSRVFDPAVEWLAKRGIAPDEVLYVGDGLHDMKAALGAGFNFLGVETGLVTKEQFRAAGAPSIREIGDLIKVS